MNPVENVARVHPRSPRFQSYRLAALVRGRLWLQVLIGMALGIATGILLGPSVGWLHAETSATVGTWLALPGQLFLATLQMIVIPLVLASVARGIAASESLEQLRSVGLLVVAFFVATTAIQPGTCISRCHLLADCSGSQKRKK